MLSVVLHLNKSTIFSRCPKYKRTRNKRREKSCIRATGGLLQMSLESSGADNSDLISRLWNMNDKLQ